MNAYKTNLTIPAGTLETAQVKKIIKLERGTIHQLEVGFPPGCAALAHVSISDRLRQFSPNNEGEYWAWDEYNLVYDPSYKLDDTPFEVVISGWNEDVRNQHIITVRLMVAPKVTVAVSGLTDLLFRQVPNQIGRAIGAAGQNVADRMAPFITSGKLASNIAIIDRLARKNGR